jgi:endo-1,4-beta-xylanase
MRPSRRAFLASLSAAAVFTQAGRAAWLKEFEDDAPLRKRATARGIVYGAAAATYQLSDATFANALAREAGILVPEYEMKRGVIEEQRGRYDFSGVDHLLAFAQAHGMALRGHPLVWHNRNPAWLDDALASRDPALMTDYITAVAGRYRGRMHSWDVVNEAIDLDTAKLRDTPWLKAFGPSYIDMAFHATRAADPHALLVYNDWGCEAAANDRFRAATLDFLEQALKRGVPIDALGLQGHLSAFGPQVDQAKLHAFLAHVKSLGLKILVTEHDVDDHGGPAEVATRDRAVADASRRFLDVVLDSNATVGVLTWGLSDRFLQPEGWRDRLFRGNPRALPLDADLQRKPLWRALANTLNRDV